MVSNARIATGRLLPALGVLLALLASMLAPRAAQAAPITAADTTTIQFSTTLKAAFKDEHSDGSLAYGVTILKGKTKIAKKQVKIERVSVYKYTDGSGPISGFLTLKWKGGTHLAFDVTGQSEAVNGTTVISGDLKLFEATGMYSGYTGFGTMTGTRKGAIGTPVNYTFVLTLEK